MIEIPASAHHQLVELAQNNNRDWFQTNRDQLETDLLLPGRAFCNQWITWLETNLGQSFQHKHYRMNRDLRFSKDKTPYHTHVRFSIWLNNHPQQETPCFHGSIEQFGVIIGAGLCTIGRRKADFLSRQEEFFALTKNLRNDPLKPLKSLQSWLDLMPQPNGQTLIPESALQQLIPVWEWTRALQESPR